MQNQILSYAYQLTEGYHKSRLACHPFLAQFYVSAVKQSLQQKQSRLTCLQYNESTPNKSTVISRSVPRSIDHIFSMADGEKGILLCVQNQAKSGKIFSVSDNYFTDEKPQLKQLFKSDTQIKSIQQRKNTSLDQLTLLNQTQISLFDMQKSAISQTLVSSEQSIKMMTIDPLHQFLTYVTNSNQILVMDKTHTKQKHSIQGCKNVKSPIQSIDYNPNKQYCLMTAHLDGLKFWDIRKGDLPTKCYRDHKSLVLNAKYNHSHDELITVSYDEGTVMLLRMSSISSSTSFNEANDSPIRLYDEHEDSVYETVWSRASPWNFVSLSYSSANVVVNTVPSVQKYRILL